MKIDYLYIGDSLVFPGNDPERWEMKYELEKIEHELLYFSCFEYNLIDGKRTGGQTYFGKKFTLDEVIELIGKYEWEEELK